MRRSLATGPWQGQDVDGALVEAVLQEVDPGIGGNHVLGEVDIGARGKRSCALSMASVTSVEISTSCSLTWASSS